MAEENKQTDLEDVIQEVEQDNNVTKVKMKKFNEEPDVVKVDLSKPPTNETKEDNPDNTRVAGSDESSEPAQEQEEVQQEAEVQGEAPVLEEVTESAEELAEEAVEAIQQAEATGQPLPENIQKLVDFMDETGGDINDYVRLNVNVDEMDSHEALHEYYKQTKPHLSEEERNFIMEEEFKFDEELDDEKQIRKKKIALKEQVAEAKAYLDGQKSKYYEEIKAGSKLTEEQQKAIDFFNRYDQESKQQKQATEAAKTVFNKGTKRVFNDKFEGFDFSVGDKKYRFKVNNSKDVMEKQSDIGNFVRKFTNKEGHITDAEAYHKSLFTAMNADAVAQHFYEQGKADAIKERVAKDKNIETGPRKTHSEVNVGGVKYKVLGDSSDGFKVKIKKRR